MARTLIKGSSVFLVLLIVTFPFSRYTYGTGFARGHVVWETETVENRLASCFHSVTGKQTHFAGQGFVPYWGNVHNKEVLWGHILFQLLAVLSIAYAGLTLGEGKKDVEGSIGGSDPVTASA